MSEHNLPSPEEMEAAKAASGMVIALVGLYFEQLLASADFNREEAFRLTRDYHWFVLRGQTDDEDES